MENGRKYEPIKESRGWYFIEYYPPKNGYRFANLHLVITGDTNPNKIAIAMEQEARIWLKRYPIPIMIASFDNTGMLYDLNNTRSSNFLISFFDKDNKVQFYWESIKNEEMPDTALNQEYVDQLYSNLVYKTDTELNIERRRYFKQLNTGRIIFFIWIVIIPAIYAIFEYSSSLLAIVALIYSLYKAIRKGLELIGKWPKSKKDKEHEREEQLKNHYYFHCQMNPEGFRKLKLENFDKMNQNATITEAEALKNRKHLNNIT
jgi:hypothetical protein